MYSIYCILYFNTQLFTILFALQLVRVQYTSTYCTHRAHTLGRNTNESRLEHRPAARWQAAGQSPAACLCHSTSHSCRGRGRPLIEQMVSRVSPHRSHRAQKRDGNAVRPARCPFSGHCPSGLSSVFSFLLLSYFVT